MYKDILQASYYAVNYFPKLILVHLRQPDYEAAEMLKNLLPQTAAGVGLQVTSTEFGFLKARLALSPNHCSAERSFEFAVNQPFSEWQLRTWFHASM